MSIATTLRAIAQELREHPYHWTQGFYAKDSEGGLTSVTKGVCWCAHGLIKRDFDSVDLRIRASSLLEVAAGVDHIPNWNDAPGRTASEVADAFDKAADLAEQS